MKVAVLKGGRSFERQVSLTSGQRVHEALERLGHDVLAVDVGHDLVARLQAATPDVAFIALHGRDGEDGVVQELLDALGLPFTGPAAASCALTSDKVLAKHLLADAGLPTPPSFSFTETAFKELGASEALGTIADRLGFPLVVKPASGGSALGVKIVRDAGELPAALVAAFSYDAKVLLEAFVAGRDLAVSVLEGVALPVVEAIPDAGQDPYTARYTIGETTFRCPAELGDDVTAEVQRLAVAAHELLGCRGFSRVDLLLDAEDRPWLLEVNAIPGLTETSLLPQAAGAAGIGFDELVERMLATARPR